MVYDDRRMAGLIIFVATFQFTIGLMLAAAVDPSYSIHDNYISDLGVRAGAPIFNVSIILLGILLAYAAYHVDRALKARWFSLLLLVPAIGTAGVGLFPETYPGLHALFSLIAFLGASLTAIATSKFAAPPLSSISVIVGVLSLVALGLFISGTYGPLGVGGMERMIVIPVLAWGLSFGGYLLAPQSADSATVLWK